MHVAQFEVAFFQIHVVAMLARVLACLGAAVLLNGIRISLLIEMAILSRMMDLMIFALIRELLV